MMLDGSVLSKLDRLSLVARHVRAGRTTGERRSTKRGASIEFADYRDYARGDDLRHVDWNIYARLERPFVKLFEEEQDLAVHLLLDGSGSMDWGDRGNETEGAYRKPGQGGESNKWLYARRLAACLGYVALRGGDLLTVASLHSGIPNSKPQFGPVRGRGNVLRLFEWLKVLETSGTTNLNESLHSYAKQGMRSGLVVLFSDLFSPAGYVEGMTALVARGHEVALVHLLAPEEVNPPLSGDLRLIDVESGEARDVTIDGGMRLLYERRLAAWREDIRAACRVRNVHYIPIETDTPFDRAVLYEMRRAALVK
jgi:uncharacterized protein (DUF58 family)